MPLAFESSAWIDAREETGTLIVCVGGELDLASRGVIEPAVLAAIPSAAAVVFDLTDLTFCDSSGITMFVTAHQKAEANGAALRFRNLSPAVARVFAISGVDQLLEIT